MTALVDQPTQQAPRRWSDLLLPFFNGVAPALVEQTLLTVIRDFCREGGVWQEELAGIVVIKTPALVTSYQAVPLTESLEVGFVLALRDDAGCEWCPVDSVTSWRAQNRSWRATFSCGPDPARINLPANALGNVEVLTPYATLVPSTTEVPLWFRQRYEHSIVEGVRAELWGTPGRPYTNTKEADAARFRYRQDRASAKHRAYRGNSRSTGAWRFPAGWP